MDENNFEYTMNDFSIKMVNGELTINDIQYEYHSDDPTYAFAREVWKYKNLGMDHA